jgi:hypothetical protein
LTKEHGVQVIASAAVLDAAGLPSDVFVRSDATVRGTSEPIAIVLINRGVDLQPWLAALSARKAA